MTADRKIPVVLQHSGKVESAGLDLNRCGILAGFRLLKKLLVTRPSFPQTIFKRLVIVTFFGFLSTAQAEGISVNKAEVRQSEKGYHLVASYDIHLTFVVQQALERGIPLYFIGEFSLTRPRWYWLDEEVFQSEQIVKLSYNVLTRQYRISRGALFQNFVSLDDALNMLSRQNSPTMPAGLIQQDSGYIAGLIKKITPESSYLAEVRLRLDTSQLPKLLQVNAMTGSDWTLDSNWYRWVIRPEEIAIRSEGKAE
jgi:hypothetical protein